MESEQTKDSFLGNIGKNVSFTSQEQEEDLLETLYVWWKEGKTVETTRLCLTMNISQQELHALVDRMVVHGYLQKREDWEVMELTSYGKDQGAECLERHQYLTQFLQMICGLGEEQAQENACRMEHVIDAEVMQGIREYMKYGDLYDRTVKHLNLLTIYPEGDYWFRCGIYDSKKRYPRILATEDAQYQEDILLKVRDTQCNFYLQKEPDASEKHEWFHTGERWKLAEVTEDGVRIPADAFSFAISANDFITEGTLMVAFTERIQLPDEEDCRELNVHLW